MGDQLLPSRPVQGRRRLVGAAIALAAAGLIAGSGKLLEQPEAAPKDLAMGWRPILSQTGRGTAQTESFEIDTGQWRIKWKTMPEEDAAGANEFRVGVHSTVSGRLMSVVIDHPGTGEGVAYVAEEPRPFFLSIESSGLEWTVAVEEGSWGEREQAH